MRQGPALRTQPLRAQAEHDLVVQGGKGAHDPGQDQVGQRRVAGEDGAVKVGRHQTLADCAVDAVAVAGTESHRAQRLHARSEDRAARVVLEPREERQPGSLAAPTSRIDHALTDAPARAGHRLRIDQAEPCHRRAVDSDVPLAKELQSRADGQACRAGVPGRPERGGRLAQRRPRGRLSCVLPAPEHIDVERGGHGGPCPDLHELRGHPAPRQPPLEHQRVAPVAVGAEQLRIEQADPDRRGGHPRSRRLRSRVNAV